MGNVATGSSPQPRPQPVKFREAIDFMRAKTRLPTRAWTDMWQDMHARAFVVAGAMKADLVKDFHEAVTRAIEEGRTLDDFRKDFDRIVATHGWSYKGSRGWRSEVIYNINMRMAHAAGRWAQIQRLKAARPYLRYVHADPELTNPNSRPDHAAQHDIVLPVDHPFWLTWFPPNDWGCRCSVMSLTEDDLALLGLEVTPDDRLPTKMVTHELNTPDGVVTIEVPEGIAPGFAYNPGAGAFGRGLNANAIARHGDKFEALDAPSAMRSAAGPLSAQRTATRPAPRVPLNRDGTANATALQDAFRRAFGGDEAIYTDPQGARVSITQAVTDHLLAKAAGAPGEINRAAYWPFIRELIESPQEIWMGFARHEESGRVYFRRRYVKLFDLGPDADGKARIIGLVADEEGGQWQSVTVMSGRVAQQLSRLRAGVRVYPGG